MPVPVVMSHPPVDDSAVPRETLSKLFLRFLRFGLLAWGGPVAQIALIRQELVEEEGWVSRERFNRVLSVYQVLPGPEATELCVYFGMLSRGRVGGLLAGLGFMLPGFVMMFALSWLYVAAGIASPVFAGLFAGFQPAVAALIVRAVHRIGEHALADGWLWAAALGSGIAQLLGANFLVTLVVAGLAYVLAKRHRYVPAALLVVALIGVSVALFLLAGDAGSALGGGPADPGPGSSASILTLLVSGFRTGLLTFGGAYTAIPFLQRDAVVMGQWMTNKQFLDGLALSGILPAPLIIFSTFVGYLGGGPLGALVMTMGVFLPAFAFTLVGHEAVEGVVEKPSMHAFLDGVTAGVVGLIAGTTLDLLRAAITGVPALIIFALALVALYRWKAKAAIVGVMLGAGLLGFILFSL